MSRKVGRGDQPDALDPESGLEALRQSPEFRGPVEPLDAHGHGDAGSNDHLASIYDTQDEQFSAAIPFVEQGLERGERCLYIADENSRETVLEAMRDRGIDADAALESGALSVHTTEDTYLRTGEFERDAMLAFWEDALELAKSEDGYSGIRAAAEMTWALGGDEDFDLLVEYESVLNTVFADDDYAVLCQYNRKRFPAAVVRDVIRTHPHLIFDNTVYHNVYYAPPEEYFGPDQPDREVDRMMGMLRERTEVKTELKERQRYLREQNEITASPDHTFEEKLQMLFELGCDRFDLELGAMACVDPETDGFVVEYTSDDHEHFEPGTELPLSETYCTAVAEGKGPASVSNPIEDGYEDIAVHRDFGVKTYLGTHVGVDGGFDRTFFFVSSESRDERFSAEEHAFHRLLGQWVQYELERQQRERHQQTLYEIAADADRTFEEKLQALFDLGCERFDLELGGLARIDPETDLFEVEAVSAEHEHLKPGARVALSETYCRVFSDDTEVAGITDPSDDGFDGTLAYDEFDVKTYLGTHLELDGDLDRTLFFVSSEPQDEAFSEAERTFHHLMGQWVQYELERQQREAELQRSKEHFERIFENSHDAIFIFDPDTDEFIDVNPAVSEMLGYAREELLGSLGPSDIHPEELDRFDAFVEEVSEAGVGWTDELTCRRADGERIPAEISASHVEIGDRECGLAVVRDVSDRKEREQAQRCLYEIAADPDRTFDEKMQAIFDLGCERFDIEYGGIARIDPETDLFEVEAINGEHEHLVPGREYPLSETYCDLVTDEGKTAVVTDPVSSGFEDKLCYKRFGVRTYLGTHLELDGDTDRTLFFVSNEPRDEEFSDAERTFHHLMGEWVRKELEREHREGQLQRKNDRLESFASMLAHELRNPVTIGQIYSQNLPDGADSESVEYVSEAFDRIEDMIDVMLVLTRGREAVGDRIPVALADAAREAWNDVDAPDATLDIDVERTIQADETYIRHLFQNLLDNAVEHGGADASVTVGSLPDVSADRSSGQRPQEDEASGGSTDESVGGFYVADDGPGVPPENRTAVFEPGYTTAPDGGGTGLGLAFVRELAEVYDWECSVTESESGGARFEFRNVSPDEE